MQNEQKEVIVNSSEAILKVKKPDYLGDSMWEFKSENRVITAKLGDENWLVKFQKGAIPLRPGDALRVKLEVTTRYDINNDIIGQSRYVITKVLKILNQEDGTQLDLL